MMEKMKHKYGGQRGILSATDQMLSDDHTTNVLIEV